MIRKIEIEFALPVEITDEDSRVIYEWVERKARQNQPEGWVHWAAEMGSKMHLSAIDARFLGKELDPEGPPSGEPIFDDSILYIGTAARERRGGEKD